MEKSSCNLYCKLKKRLIGDLLISGKFINKEILDKALREQKRTNRLLGELLVDLGALSEDELNIVLRYQEDLSNPKEAIKFASGLRRRLGELLLEIGKITQKELEEALSIQKTSGKKIGEILVERGLINEKELKAVLLFQRAQDEKHTPKVSKLGELLVSLNIINEEQLEAALRIQRDSPEKKLGEILIESGYASEKDIEKGLTIQQKLATIALSTLMVFSNNFFINEVSARDSSYIESPKGKVQITAEVRGFAKFNLIRQVKELIITENHISKGYIELPDATLLTISTNTKSLLLVLEGFADGIIEEVEIYGLPEPVKIGPNGGMVFIKNIPKRTQYNLSYRLKISKNARAGTYEWPYTISVNPF